jgi:hypothetical protein
MPVVLHSFELGKGVRGVTVYKELTSNMFMMPPRAMLDQLMRFFWPGMAGPASIAIASGSSFLSRIGWGLQ